MKKRLMLFVVLCFLISIAKAQTNNNGFGKFYDINELPLSDYCDFDYTPEKVFKISLVIGEKDTPGAYYDLNGVKHEGLITIDRTTNEFSFKKDKTTTIEVLSPESCSGIKLGTDSFAVIKNFEIRKAFGKSLMKAESFAEVIAENSGYTLYKHSRFGFGTEPMETFVIKTDTSNHLTSIFNSATLIRYFGDCKLLKKQISNGYFKIDDLPSISKIYEYSHKFKNNSKIFYSSSWDEQKDSVNSEYFAKIISIKDTIWELSFFNHQGKPIYCGHFASFSPGIKHGDFLWFYPNGNIRKKINYKNNEISGTVTEYYTNGSPHYVYKFKRKKIIYEKILDKNGQDILSAKGKGNEEIFDSVLNRAITLKYYDFKLVISGFISNDRKLVLTQCEENARLQSFNSLQRRIDKNIIYPQTSFMNYRHGVILVLFTVDTEGKSTDFKIIKGLDNDCDEQILKFLTEQKTKITWDPAKNKGIAIEQQIIVPFYFEISGMTLGRNNTYFYDHSWMWRNQFPQPKFNPPPVPTYRMR
jgi:antitoxin component YwqK of YwqJK toxin-antitoxin module